MRRLTPVFIFTLIFILGVIYLPGFSKYLKLRNKEVGLQQEIENLKSEISKLEEEERLLKTDVTRFEEVVREELKLVKQGETVIRVVEEEVPASPAGSSKARS